MTTEAQPNPSRAEIETSKLVAEMINLMTDTRRMQVETLKLQTETRWHPFFIGAGVFSAGGIFIGAVIAAVKVFL